MSPPPRAVRLAALLLAAAMTEPLSASAQETGPLESRVADVAKLFRAEPSGYDSLFAPGFLARVPAARLTQIFRDYHEKYGEVSGFVRTEAKGPYAGSYRLTMAGGYGIPLQISVESSPPHLVQGLWIGVAVPLSGSLEEAVAALDSLPGQLSFLAARLGEGAPEAVAQLDSGRALAIGSAFKLYVLAELVRQVEEGRRAWTDVVRLDSAGRSLPSGTLQGWPPGTPLTLQSLATLMISRSDNTAADALLRTLGRKRVESVLEATGHAEPARTLPFLTTREMFVLKGGPDAGLADRYAAAGVAERRRILSEDVDPVPLDSVSPPSAPDHVASIEWFASAADLARVMDWLRKHSEGEPGAPARGILAVNPGLRLEGDRWSYVGYKGGSEPGVLSMAFLLRDRSAHWFAVAASWNDPSKEVDLGTFAGLVQRTIQLLPQGG